MTIKGTKTTLRIDKNQESGNKQFSSNLNYTLYLLEHEISMLMN